MNQMIHTPVGVRDVYGPELARKLAVMDKIHDQLHIFGYKDIETPVFEFLEVFSEKVGTTPTKDLYKFFDKDGNILCLRPDFTPSIARCAAKYFVEDSMPIRLCYKGRSFVNASEYQGKLKESTQMGVELIEPENNTNTAASDAEMILLMIKSLIASGIKDFHIAIGQIGYFKGLCNQAGLSDEDVIKLRDYIEVKNYFGAEELLSSLSVSKDIIDSILNVSDLTSVDELRDILSKISNDESKMAINNLLDIVEIINESGYEKYISFDLSLINRFDYYSGVIFRAYTYGVGDAIIKGGRYDDLIDKFGKKSSAVGFVFLIDEIMSALNANKIEMDLENDLTWLVYDADKANLAFAKAAELREKSIACALVAYDKTKTEEDYKEYAKANAIKEIVFIKD